MMDAADPILMMMPVLRFAIAGRTSPVIFTTDIILVLIIVVMRASLKIN